MELVEQKKAFGGMLEVFDHQSETCHCVMRFAVFTPQQAKTSKVPVIWYLSGLTCNWSNVMEKSGIMRLAAEHGFMVIAPDTSPRGDDVANDDGYDLGQGAGFYINATQAPWAKHFHMETYIAEELPALIKKEFANADLERQGITGHSMGGHGALTLHLKNPGRYKSVSAFAPIVAPSKVPWGEKAFSAYIGEDRTDWLKHDACALVTATPSDVPILIDQGTADNFLEEQLQTHLFDEACDAGGQKVEINMREGYDHSYYFIATFLPDHFEWHAKALKD
ncbi:S-formylglutathione hydrolase [Ahrensia marina]|uniref:S-formylglutathione hydrolase n=1 Tax=Ahrensia marina TaxID=1514904 RepID=A0A0M9GQ52_9HYPH|nr:S-formylglutathione hydrolase [Ahrensia marina]KPB02809.1 S-formylglutathione hydrolase [Ahrensia marina]